MNAKIKHQESTANGLTLWVLSWLAVWGWEQSVLEFLVLDITSKNPVRQGLWARPTRSQVKDAMFFSEPVTGW